jgi:hypothetical protein
LAPAGTEGFAGVTAIDVNKAAVTVSEAVPLMELSEAVIVAGPAATPFARPALDMVATPVSEEDQLAASVWVEPSE